MSIRNSQFKQLSQMNAAVASAVENLRNNPGIFATTVQFGVTTLGVAAGALGAHVIYHVAHSNQHIVLILYLIGTVLAIAALCVMLGDMLPVAIAMRFSTNYVVFFARILWWLTYVCKPMALFMHKSSHRVGIPSYAHIDEPDILHESTTIEQLIEESIQLGSLHPGAAAIATRALSFGHMHVADLMVPRNRIDALPIDATYETMHRFMLEEGHAYTPIYNGTLDHIVGLLKAKDVLALAWQKNLFILQDLLQTPYFVPEFMCVADLFKDMQHNHIYLAIVVDELGGTSGIITMHDLLRELSGNISDANSTQQHHLIHYEKDGMYVLQGSLPLRDTNRELHLDLEEGDNWSTIGGLCVHLAGCIPKIGDVLLCDNNCSLEILEATPRHISLVRLRTNIVLHASIPTTTSQVVHVT